MVLLQVVRRILVLLLVLFVVVVGMWLQAWLARLLGDTVSLCAIAH